MNGKALQKPLAVFLSLCLLAPAGAGFASTAGAPAGGEPAVARPTASVDSGTYRSAQTVRLRTETQGARIFYTTDGKRPTAGSTRYRDPIRINRETRLRAVAIRNGVSSPILTRDYSLPPYLNRNGFRACSQTERDIYHTLYEGIMAFQENISIPGPSVGELSLARVFSRVQLDNPHLLQLPKSYRVSINRNTNRAVSVLIQYVYTKPTYDRMMTRMNRQADSIITRARRQSNAPDRIRVIHDEILKGARYGGSGSNTFNAFGVLVDGRGVCESYARAFQYICQRMDIPVLLVGGYSREPHMWNMVRVGKSWWHIDPTWNHPIVNGRHRIAYDFFLLSDRDIRRTHRIDPVATRTDGLGHFNYFKLPKTPANTVRRDVHKAA